MKNILLLIFTASVFLIASCGSGKQKMQNDIASAEQKLKNDSAAVPDKQKAVDVIHQYLAYADKFQDDSMSAEYLFRAADLTNGIHQPEKAIELYQRIQRYPTYSKTSIALFLQGFISETELNDIPKAKEYYEKFLEQYPDHKLANDVRVSLANLGKSPGELIKEFEAKAKSDSVKLSTEVKK